MILYHAVTTVTVSVED